MNSLNTIILEGNVVRDPTVKETAHGTSVCMFALASNRFYRQDSGTEKEVSYFDIESWGKLAEKCSENCPKGRGVRVVGRLKQDRWTGSDGKNHARVKIIADHVEFRPVFRKNDEDASEAAEALPEQAAAESVPAF